MKRIYLDNSATTAVDPPVLEAMIPYFVEDFGNASSVHLFGQKAKAAVEAARAQVAELIGADPREVVFTSGGTEADNLAVKGAAWALANYGRHIITSKIEHPAVYNCCQQLEQRGFEVTYLPVDETGLIRLDELERALRDDTILISVMAANNEIGTLQPIAEIGQMVAAWRRRQHTSYPYVHTDAVQAVGKIPINVDEWGVDLLSLSGHKIHAPKGIGALYVRQGIRLEAHMHGGHHERDRRAGTENVPGIVGLGKAAELAREHGAEWMNRVRELRDYMETEIERRIPDVVFNGHRQRRVPNVCNCSFRSIQGEALMIRLDLRGVAVSTGSACASGSIEPSPVLLALGRDRELARGSIRISLSKNTTREEIDEALEILTQEVEALRAMSPLERTATTQA
ncbi:MAG: cysteine desulfurase NifS [Acidobacteriota bacterium]|nr:cysteine desulfurase NifS [Blastocatellia bacterium]MDW8239548.1 cysteine desulfurase NifS [Acidobacteriota bacterium]